MPIFANPLGLWVLLGVPAILAIHFLQQRAPVVRTSTWFLIEKLAPDSARGRNWDRLRASRNLWLQLLAIVLGAWLLAEPRWVRSESAQTVVLVFDASLSMTAFRPDAIAAAEREIATASGLAARTTWIVMTTHAAQPALYRGTEHDEARAALQRWEPELGRHDVAPALRLARSLSGGAGRTLFITDSRDKAPADQRTAGVGRVIENVGFAGATVSRDETGVRWRAVIKNHGTTPQTRRWHLEVGGAVSPPQRLELAPGALAEVSGPFTGGVNRATVVLEADAFAADDWLPMVVPEPKPLTVVVAGTEEPAPFFRRVLEGIEGVTVRSQGETTPAPQASLEGELWMGQASAEAIGREPRGGIFWPAADRREQASLLSDPVTPDRDPLVDGLNWQGWFGTGPHGFSVAPGDRTLLWHGRWPLVFLRSAGGETAASALGRKLILAFDWSTSNAARLPATVLLVRRFVEAERDAQRAPYAANFDAGALVPISGYPLEGRWTLQFAPIAEAVSPAPPGKTATFREILLERHSDVRAPGRAGYFEIHHEGQRVVSGAAQFADPRQGDFRQAETFFADVGNARAAAIERNTTGDPLVLAWLLALAGLMLWTWWPPGARPALARSADVAYPRTRDAALLQREP